MKMIVQKVTANGYMLVMIPQGRPAKRQNWLERVKAAIRRVMK